MENEQLSWKMKQVNSDF